MATKSRAAKQYSIINYKCYLMMRAILKRKCPLSNCETAALFRSNEIAMQQPTSSGISAALLRSLKSGKFPHGRVGRFKELPHHSAATADPAIFAHEAIAAEQGGLDRQDLEAGHALLRINSAEVEPGRQGGDQSVQEVELRRHGCSLAMVW
ncbi:hypothetical protein [Jiella mangrovi]|uniref:hypothetical protein n=1 Tax=Jiella mangrovi TaxID=2821407 RepID=UPI003CC91E20